MLQLLQIKTVFVFSIKTKNISYTQGNIIQIKKLNIFYINPLTIAGILPFAVEIENCNHRNSH